MPDPEGRLTTPVGINSEGLPRAWNALWGYSEQYREVERNSSPAGTQTDLNFSAPATGEIWMVLGVCTTNHTSATDRVAIYVPGWSVFSRLTIIVSPARYVPALITRPVVLKNPDYIRARFIGHTVGDDLRATAWGYKMEL